MKPIPTKIDGIQFRSKLEARWYLFMKELEWHIEYEPQEIEGINGWIPDFIIIGNNKKILVDVKPIYSLNEWNESHPSYKKILESGIKNTEYELLIVGASFDLGGNAFGILYEHFLNSETQTGSDCFEFSGGTVFTFDENSFMYGFLPYDYNWECRITGESGKLYLFDGHHKYDELKIIWNECGSKLQWNKNGQE